MSAAVDIVVAEHGSVGVLVNNAGYALQGSIEETSLEEVRAQFEANVFGLVRLCQLVLPGMRSAGTGTIVNMGSMGGRFTFPGGGFYHASKHAVEAVTDALRLEVASFGVRVVLVEPGPVQTAFGDTAMSTMTEDGGRGQRPVRPVQPRAGRALRGGVRRAIWTARGLSGRCREGRGTSGELEAPETALCRGCHRQGHDHGTSARAGRGVGPLHARPVADALSLSRVAAATSRTSVRRVDRSRLRAGCRRRPPSRAGSWPARPAPSRRTAPPSLA